MALGAQYTTVAETTLPTGQYVIHAKADIGGLDTTNRADCVMQAGSNTNAEDGNAYTIPAGGGSTQVTMDGANRYTTSTTIVVRCRTTTATSAYDTRLIAIKTGVLHGDEPLPWID